MNERFSFIVEHTGKDPRPVEIRLRLVLKIALRDFGLRTVDMRVCEPVVTVTPVDRLEDK